MVRSVFGKVMWVGRATVFLVGLAVILALVFGVASVALAGMGVGAPFHLGKINTVDKVSTLVNEGRGPALSLQASSGAPLKVNSATRVAKLNADMVDNMEGSVLVEPRGYAQVSISCAATPNPATTNLCQFSNSKGIIGIKRPDPPGNVYCFDLSFTPKTAVASAHINNNATVGTVLGSGVPSSCPQPYRDAAAKTYAANDSNAETMVHNDINFGIVFM